MSEKTSQNNLKAVDFFCGGGGMSCGMQQAGVKVLGGIDYELKCKETYETNLKGAKFLHKDITKISLSTLSEEFNIEKDDDNLILIGCSPCQYWSIINTEKKKSKKSKNLLKEFRRFVEYYNPGYVVVENVPGVLRKKRESGLSGFIRWFRANGYKVHFDNHNINDYDVPQSRKRFTLIANRVTTEELKPIKSIGDRLLVKDVLGIDNGFDKIEAGTKDSTEFQHTVAGLSETNIKRLEKVPKDGGNRLAFANDPDLQLSCFIGKDDSFKDTFGRLWWNKPSPTITTKFFSVSNGRFVHPEENRALSIREGATLQSFPKTFNFKTNSIADTARIIGNAVPPNYAKAVAKAILQNHINAI